MQDAFTLGEMKRSVCGAMQPKGMAMTAIIPAEIIGVVLIVVRFSVAIKIVQTRDLSAIEHEHPIGIDPNAYGLIEP